MFKKIFSSQNYFWIISPSIIFLLIFFLAPFIVLLYYSLLTIEQGNIIAGPTFNKYVELLTDPFTYYLFGRTIGLSMLVTILCVIFGFPVAYLHSKINQPILKTVILAIVSAPLLTSSLVLSFGWIVILGKRGLINSLLLASGIIVKPVKILFTLKAVIIALTQVMLPFMIVPLISTLQKLPRDLEDAAADLGANKWQTFWRVTIPQSIPSIAAGMTLVFVLSYTAFTVPSLAGGSAMQIVSVYIWNNVRQLTWDSAAAISSLLLASSLVIITIFNYIVRRLLPWKN